MGYFKRHLVSFEQHNKRSTRHVDVTFEAEHIAGEKKVLLVRLSDEKDLYFLYLCHISEDEFAGLKTQQGLLVDFTGFEQKVIDLLEICLQEERSSVPRYTLKFTTSNNEKEGVLQIVEATNFKYLVHLSLALHAGNDETIKSYLVAQLKALKLKSQAEIERLMNSIGETSAQLMDCEKALDSTSKEFSAYKTESQLREADLKRNHEIQIRSLEDQFVKAEEKHTGILEDERRTSAQKIEDLRQDLISRIDRLTQENHELKDEREQLQLKLKRLSNQNNILEEQVASQSSEMVALRAKLVSTEQTTQNKASDVIRLENRLNALEQELVTKDQLLSKLQDSLNTEQEQKSRLQEELQQNCRQVEKLQSSLGRETEEINKANEIIKRLQTEVKSYHTKAKLRGQVAAEQERLLSSKDAELQELHSEMDRLKQELQDAKDSETQLTDRINSMSIELADAHQTLKTNENIITWLNRQISESQLGNVHNRLRSAGFPTPINMLGTMRPMSPPTTSNSNTANLPSVPPWYPSMCSALPCSTMISRPTPVPVTSPTILPPSLRPATTTTTNGVHTTSSGLSMPSLRTAVTTGVTGSHLPLALDANILSKRTEARQSFLPAPITKSTPVHTDGPPRSIGSSEVTNTVRSGPVFSQSQNPLPTYVPSTILTKSHQPNTDGTAPTTSLGIDHCYLAGRHAYGSITAQDDSDRTAHQQSLTSAYFPKPVGASNQR